MKKQTNKKQTKKQCVFNIYMLTLLQYGTNINNLVQIKKVLQLLSHSSLLTSLWISIANYTECKQKM